MGILSHMKSVFGIVGELFKFLWKRKLWWLIPFMIVILIFGILLMFANATGIAPFIYPLI